MMDWESPCEAIIDGGSSELMEVLIKSMVAKVEGASMGTWLRDHDADRNETVQYKVFVSPAQLRTASLYLGPWHSRLPPAATATAYPCPWPLSIRLRVRVLPACLPRQAFKLSDQFLPISVPE